MSLAIRNFRKPHHRRSRRRTCRWAFTPTSRSTPELGGDRAASRLVRVLSNRRSLLAFVGTVDPACKWTTIGDVMALYNVARRLESHGVEFDIAWSGPLMDLDRRRIYPVSIRPEHYQCFVYVCGPIHRGLAPLFTRFAGMRRVAAGVSVIAVQDPHQWFDAVHVRDSLEGASCDLAVADIGWPHLRLPTENRKDAIGTCLVGPQLEYGPGNSLFREAEKLIDRALVLAGGPPQHHIQTAVKPLEPNPYSAELDLQSMKSIITTRMHGSLLCLFHEVPVLSVDTVRGGAKVTRVVSATGWPVLRADSASPQEMAQFLLDLQSGKFRPLAQRCSARMVALSRAALNEAVEMILSRL